MFDSADPTPGSLTLFRELTAAEQREPRRGEIPSGLPFIGPEDPQDEPETHRPLAGACEQNRGGSIVFRIGADPPVRTRTIVQTPHKSGDDAESILVTLGPLQGVPRTTPVEFVGLIEWGVGGATFAAEVDWCGGTVFALPASFCRVSARLARAEGAPADVLVAASLSYGQARGGFTSPARRTVTVGHLVGGAVSPVFEIPAWARSFVVLSGDAGLTDDGDPNIRVHVGDAEPASWVIYSDFTSRSNGVSQNAGAVDLPNGARVFSVENRGSRTATSIRVVFSLGF